MPQTLRQRVWTSVRRRLLIGRRQADAAPRRARRRTMTSARHHQSINIRLLRHDKMQANNSKQKGNTVSKKKSMSR